MHAHFRRTAGRKSLRSAKEFPNYFQTAVSLKKQRTSSNGHRSKQWMGGSTMCFAAGLNCGESSEGNATNSNPPTFLKAAFHCKAPCPPRGFRLESRPSKKSAALQVYIR